MAFLHTRTGLIIHVIDARKCFSDCPTYRQPGLAVEISWAFPFDVRLGRGDNYARSSRATYLVAGMVLAY